MTLLLVRHAVAMARHNWTGPDASRPLTARGALQAERLVHSLGPFEVQRILSSPAVRCLDTVDPLASQLGLPVEHLDALAEGMGTAAAPLVADLDGVTVVCTHGDVVPELLGALVPEAMFDGDPRVGKGLRCAKASTWVLESDRKPRYLPAPE